MVNKLVRRYRIQEKDIAVLSQYRAQCSDITGRLQRLPQVTVSTVIAAQGQCSVSATKAYITIAIRLRYESTIRQYHDAFDYDGSDRNYDLRSILLRYDYDTTTTKN